MRHLVIVWQGVLMQNAINLSFHTVDIPACAAALVPIANCNMAAGQSFTGFRLGTGPDKRQV